MDKCERALPRRKNLELLLLYNVLEGSSTTCGSLVPTVLKSTCHWRYWLADTSHRALPTRERKGFKHGRRGLYKRGTWWASKDYISSEGEKQSHSYWVEKVLKDLFTTHLLVKPSHPGASPHQRTVHRWLPVDFNRLWSLSRQIQAHKNRIRRSRILQTIVEWQWRPRGLRTVIPVSSSTRDPRDNLRRGRSGKHRLIALQQRRRNPEN